MKEKVLIYRKEIILGTLIFIVSTLSFALGYIANREMNHAPIVIEACTPQN